MLSARYRGKKEIVSAAIGALIFLSLVSIAYVPIQAFTNSLTWRVSSSNAACGASYNFNPGPQTTTANDPLIIGIAHAANAPTVTAVTDNLNVGGYTYAKRQQLTGSMSLDVEIWFVPASVAGTLNSVTITFSGAAGGCAIILWHFNTGPITTPSSGGVSGVATNGLSFSANQCLTGDGTASCNFSGGILNILPNTLSVIFNAANFAYSGLNDFFNICIANMNAQFGGNGQCTNAGPWTYINSAGYDTAQAGTVQIHGGWYYSSVAQSASVGAVYFNQVGVKSNIAMDVLSFMFVTQGVYYKTTAAIETIGCQAYNSTQFTLTKNDLVWIRAQADPQGVSIANMSAVIDSIVTASVTLALGIYISPIANNSVPSLGNAFALAYSATFNAAINANKQVLSTAPSVAVKGWHWYALAIAQTDAGSGVVKLRVSTTSNPYFDASGLAVSTLPATITTSPTVATNHAPCIFGFALNTPVLVGIGGGSSASTTSGVVIAQPSPTTAGFWFIPMLFLLFPTAIFIGIYVTLVSRRR